MIQEIDNLPKCMGFYGKKKIKIKEVLRMKRISFVIIVLLIVLAAVILLVGRGERPKNPYYDRSSMFDLEPNTLVEKQGFLKDIDYYLNIIDEVHSNPYNLVSKDEIWEKTRNLKKEVEGLKKDKIPAIDCYFYLQRVATFLQDEHTSVWLNKKFKKWLEEVKYYFPFKIKIIRKKIYLARDFGKNGVPASAELISINNYTVKELLDAGMQLVNQTLPHYREQIANKSFKMWLDKYFKIPPPWTLKYKHNGKENIVTVEGLSKENEKKDSTKSNLYFESVFEVRGEKIPILVLPKFWFPDKKKYKEFIGDFFNKYENKKQIIIDLRNNPGGDGRFAYYLLNYLIDEPYISHTRFDFKISQVFVNYARQQGLYGKYWEKKIPRLLWWFPFYKFDLKNYYWWDKARKGNIGEYVIDHDAIETPDPKIKKYKGKVYLLISNYTNSAAVVFSAIFKYYNLGTIIGRETGGRISFTSDSIILQMPDSKLAVWVPTAILSLPGNNPDRGVLPDVPVELSIQDQIAGIDVDRDIEKLKEILLGK